MTSTSSVYKYVMEDVIKNIKHEFLSEGIPESVLAELQQVWEAKLAQSDTAAQPAAPAAETDVNQHLAYFYSNNAYNLDAASMPPESALLLNPSYAQHMARAAAGYSHPQPQEPPVEPQYGRPQPYMPPQEWSANSLAAYSAARQPTSAAAAAQARGRPAPQHPSNLPQYDGGDDDDDDDGDDDLGIKKENDGDEDLGSDLDDEEGEEPDTDNIALCQFEKVTRIKNKRKCNLKAGVMHLNGRDYLFNRANGEFEW